MALDPALRSLVEEALAPLGHITLRPMFGGGGVCCDGLMFALLACDTLYLKVDRASKATFLAAGLRPSSTTARASR